MIGGGSKRVLGIAGRDADIVSLNFDNSSGKIGPAGVGSSTAELTAQKIEWIRAGAGDRFDDIEIEIGAYFTVVTDDASTVEKMAAMFALDARRVRRTPARADRFGRLDLRAAGGAPGRATGSAT